MRPAAEIVRRPVLTEKGTRMKEAGHHVVFEVARDANKAEIRQAIEKLFSVKVEAVRTQMVRGKSRRLGRFWGKRPNWKKAIVRLGEGHEIDFFAMST